MKICLVTHSLIKGDGQGRVNYEVAREAIRRGHELTVLASDIADDLKAKAAVTWIKISVEKLPSEILRNIYFSFVSAVWIKRNKNKFDIIKVNGAITNVFSDVNAVHFIHSSWLTSSTHTSKIHKGFYGCYQWIYTWLNSYWEKQAFRKAKVVVAVSQRIANELISIGVPANKIQIVLNGVDLQEFSPSPSDRNLLGLPEKSPLAIFVGDIQTPRKNLDSVLQALAQVPSLHLAVAGGVEGSPYPKLAQQLNIDDRVHFLGYRSDISQLMQATDFLVFPSRYEPWGLVVVEAMATGLPVITASTVGAAELITNKNGIVLEDPNDIPALLRAMVQLTDNPTYRQKMGKAAYESVRAYSWEKMSAQYIDLFEAIQKQQAVNEASLHQLS